MELVLIKTTLGELNLNGDGYGIVKFTGVEASEYALVSQEHIQADGATVMRRRVATRPISIEFDYRGPDKDINRERLIRMLSIKTPGTLMIDDREIEYEVEKLQFKDNSPANVLQIVLDLQCPSPAFKSSRIVTPVMTLEDGWKWKFTLPFHMKRYGELKRNIYNAGHMETPVEILFQGPAINPKIINHRTGQYVRLKKELTTDDVLYINTEYNNKIVEIRTGDTVEDGWDYLDLKSDFWWLLPGDNMVEYSSEGEAVKSKGVEVCYKERFFGV